MTTYSWDTPGHREHMRFIMQSRGAIFAIKTVRESYGLTLREAKEYVDGLKEDNIDKLSKPNLTPFYFVGEAADILSVVKIYLTEKEYRRLVRRIAINLSNTAICEEVESYLLRVKRQ